MNKIILADSQAIFRAGTAKVLAADDDLRIVAQCADLDRLLHAVTTFPGAVVLFAASLRPEMGRLRRVLESAGSRGIVIAENSDIAAAYLQQGFRGVVFRSVTGPSLIDCVRRVAAGDTWIPPQLVVADSQEEDTVGARVRDRLTPKARTAKLRSGSRPPNRSSRTISARSTTRPGSATGWNWPCSPFITACWLLLRRKLAASSKPKSSRPLPSQWPDDFLAALGNGARFSLSSYRIGPKNPPIFQFLKIYEDFR